MRTAKTLIRLCGHWVAKDPGFLRADSEDSNLRWAHRLLSWFVVLRLNYVIDWDQTVLH